MTRDILLVIFLLRTQAHSRSRGLKEIFSEELGFFGNYGAC